MVGTETKTARLSLRPLPIIQRITLIQQALFLLYRDPFLCQLGDAFLQDGRGEHGLRHVFRKASIEDWLPNEVIVGAPALTGDVEGDFS